DKIIKNEVSKYTDLAITYLDKLSISSNKKQSLKQFAISLMRRKV
ncbi:MAG: polyprenyl synthetase, partial [Flavobacteriales bacterium]